MPMQAIAATTARTLRFRVRMCGTSGGWLMSLPHRVNAPVRRRLAPAKLTITHFFPGRPRALEGDCPCGADEALPRHDVRLSDERARQRADEGHARVARVCGGAGRRR